MHTRAASRCGARGRQHVRSARPRANLPAYLGLRLRDRLRDQLRDLLLVRLCDRLLDLLRAALALRLLLREPVGLPLATTVGLYAQCSPAVTLRPLAPPTWM